VWLHHLPLEKAIVYGENGVSLYIGGIENSWCQNHLRVSRFGIVVSGNRIYNRVKLRQAHLVEREETSDRSQIKKYKSCFIICHLLNRQFCTFLTGDLSCDSCEHFNGLSKLMQSKR